VPKANKFICTGRILAESCSDQNIFSGRETGGRRGDLRERLCTEIVREKGTLAPLSLLQILFQGWIKNMVLRYKGTSSSQKELPVREQAFMKNHG
jgi:hypothetical protein